MNSHPIVTAIVPARNEEATIAAAVESLAAQPEILEIIVINDQSTDGTAEQLDRLASRYPQLRILETGELPPGWVGKNYAVSLGAAQASGDWLLFTDADAVHLPGSTARALADAAENSAGLVSYSPEQETRTWWEKALIPLVYTRLARKYSLAEVNDPNSPAAAANGQFLMMRREDYQRIGGHAAVAGEVLEDVAIARLAKQAGVRLYFASGKGIVRVRMYRTFGAMWQGWTKNLYPLMGTMTRKITGKMTENISGMSADAIQGPDEGPERMPRTNSGAAPDGTGTAGTEMRRASSAVSRELFRVIPWIPLLILPLAVLHLIWGVLAIVLLAGRHAAYAADLRRNGFPASLAIYYLPGVALYGVALLYSEWRYLRGSVAWKGREYPVSRES